MLTAASILAKGDFQMLIRVRRLCHLHIELAISQARKREAVGEPCGVTPIDWTVKRAKLERGEEFLGSIFFSLLRRFVFPFSVVFRHAVEKRLSHLPYNARSHTG